MQAEIAKSHPATKDLFSMHTTWSNLTHSFSPTPKYTTHPDLLHQDLMDLQARTHKNSTLLTPPPPQHVTSSPTTAQHAHHPIARAKTVARTTIPLTIGTYTKPPQQTPPPINTSAPTSLLPPQPSIQIISWNIGPGGLLSNLQPTLLLLNQHNPAIVHLQDTRLTKNSATKLKEIFETLAPNYKLFTNCKAESDKAEAFHAIATAIHRSILPYTKQCGTSTS